MPPAEPTPPAFDLLAEGVQRQLYRMGWPALRPIQAEAIRAYFGSDHHLLIMAETAGGKTEAAFLPVLSAISTEPTGSVRAIYVGPLKALINDQFGRLEELCTHLDVPVHRWHGDVGAGHKTALVKDPSGVLLITPESLESLLINRTSHLPRLFGGLRAIVIDEVHAFLEGERGLHLASLLVRVRRYMTPGEPQPRMLGLSATVGDVTAAQRYLSPDTPETVRVIEGAGGKEVQFRIHGYMKEDPPQNSAADGNGTSSSDEAQLKVMAEIAADLVEHCRSHSNLIFANSKGDIELYADMANEACREAGLPETFLVHHGSLAKDVREDTESTMKAGRPMTTICSSTLEMGIDIGSVRMVGQIGAPWSVASFKQRLGRSGRRDDEPRRLRGYVICERSNDPDDPLGQIPLDMLQTIAVCELMLKKWIEPPQPATLDMSTLTHQVISTIAEVGAIEAAALYARLCREGPFRGFTPSLFARVLRDLGAKDVVEQGADSKLILGLTGEQLRASKDFYAAFASKVEYTVVGGGRAIGTLPMDTVPKAGEHIVLAARRWQVTDVDPVKRVLGVVPARRRQRPLFTGGAGEIHGRVREEMMAILTGTEIPIYLDTVAREVLARAREAARQRGLAERGVIELDRRHSLWLTWTGTRQHRTLLAWLASIGITTVDRRVAIECKAPPPQLMMHLRSLGDTPPDLLTLATFVSCTHFRKYDGLFSEDLLASAIAQDHL